MRQTKYQLYDPTPGLTKLASKLTAPDLATLIALVAVREAAEDAADVIKGGDKEESTGMRLMLEDPKKLAVLSWDLLQTFAPKLMQTAKKEMLRVAPVYIAKHRSVLTRKVK